MSVISVNLSSIISSKTDKP